MALPTPYYQEGGITIYHGDCREILPDIPAGSVDLVLTDPPFFMPATHYQSRVHHQRAWGDTSILKAFAEDFIAKSVRTMRDTGHFLVFCNHESFCVFYPVLYGQFDFLKSLVWDKGHVGLGRVWRNQHELIIAARWSSSIFVEDGELRADVLKYAATPPSSRLHPVEKPTPMLADLLRVTVGRGGVVCDPFAGSGTTLEAAKLHEHSAIGIEIEERYCEIAANRLAQGVFDFRGTPDA